MALCLQLLGQILEIFQTYKEYHLFKYPTDRGAENKMSILNNYNGHKCHVSVPFIEWAKGKSKVFCVSPLNCSPRCESLSPFLKATHAVNNNFPDAGKSWGGGGEYRSFLTRKIVAA